MKLPNGDRAIVDVTKLRGYVLSQAHPRGKHKARVFLAALEMAATDAEELRTAPPESDRVGDAVRCASDEFGIRYTVDFDMVRSNKRARVRGAWIIRTDDGLPRLASCYVL